MAVTMADLALASTDKLVQGFINEIVTDSFLLEQLPFDNTMTATGTSNLVYAYDRTTEGATAKFRALNEEPEVSNIKVEKVTTQPGILSSAWDIDRVAKAANEALYQEKLTEGKNAIIRGFGDAFINGKKAENSLGFDGLSTILKGTSTEMQSAVDLTAVTKESALAFASEMDDMLSLLTRDPDAIIVSRAMKNRMNAVCRMLGINSVTMDDAGHRVQTWDGIRIDECRGGAVKNNDVYACCFGTDELLGITLANNAVTVTVPDWNAPGAVKKGDAEFVCGIALKKTKAAGVLRAKAGAAAASAGVQG